MRSKFTIMSSDPVPVVRGRLAAALATTTHGMLSGATTFRGTVSDSGFRVVRNPVRTERTMPLVATGRFTPTSDGTAVEVTTRPQWSWLFVSAAFVAVGMLWPLGRQGNTTFADTHAFWTYLGFSVVVGGFVLMIVFIGCTIEERRYREALTKLLQTGAA